MQELYCILSESESEAKNGLMKDGESKWERRCCLMLQVLLPYNKILYIIQSGAYSPVYKRICKRPTQSGHDDTINQVAHCNHANSDVSCIKNRVLWAYFALKSQRIWDGCTDVNSVSWHGYENIRSPLFANPCSVREVYQCWPFNGFTESCDTHHFRFISLHEMLK